MDNVRPENTEDQSVTYPSGEDMGRNFHVSVPNASEILHCDITQDLGLPESGRMTMLQV